eukprot:3017905-Rhodomonas_salina.2
MAGLAAAAATPLLGDPEGVSAATEEDVEVYFGCGCFWFMPHPPPLAFCLISTRSVSSSSSTSSSPLLLCFVSASSRQLWFYPSSPSLPLLARSTAAACTHARFMTGTCSMNSLRPRSPPLSACAAMRCPVLTDLVIPAAYTMSGTE